MRQHEIDAIVNASGPVECIGEARGRDDSRRWAGMVTVKAKHASQIVARTDYRYDTEEEAIEAAEGMIRLAIDMDARRNRSSDEDVAQTPVSEEAKEVTELPEGEEPGQAESEKPKKRGRPRKSASKKR